MLWLSRPTLGVLSDGNCVWQVHRWHLIFMPFVLLGNISTGNARGSVRLMSLYLVSIKLLEESFPIAWSNESSRRRAGLGLQAVLLSGCVLGPRFSFYDGLAKTEIEADNPTLNPELPLIPVVRHNSFRRTRKLILQSALKLSFLVIRSRKSLLHYHVDADYRAQTRRRRARHWLCCSKLVGISLCVE